MIAAAAVVALLLLAPVPAPAAEAENGEGLREIAHLDSGLLMPNMMFEAFDTASLNLFDVDEDGVVEIVSQNDNNRLYVIDPVNQRLEAELTTGLSDSWGSRTLNGVAIGDVDGDGKIDLVSGNPAGRITLFTRDDAGRWSEEWGTLIDRSALDPHYSGPRELGMDGAPYLADVDGDGKLEAFAQLDNTYGHAAVDDNGSVMWFQARGDGNANPVVDDLDGDGDYEAIFATDGGRILTYDAETGELLWLFDSKKYGAWPASIPVSPGVFDLDGDGKKELYFATRQANNHNESQNPQWYMEQHAYFFSVDHDGELRWYNQYPPHGNPLSYNHPAAVDVTGDGVDEILFQDWNTIGHKPGQWQSTGDGNLFAIDQETGEMVWRAPINTPWSNKDFLVADVQGDEEPEIVATAAEGGHEGLLILNLDGERVGFVPVAGDWHASRGPVYADLNGDGTGEIVLPVMRSKPDGGCRKDNIDVGCREGALKVFATGKDVNAPFPANFLFNAETPEVEVKPGFDPWTLEPEDPSGNDTDNATGNQSGDGNGTYGYRDDGDGGDGDGDGSSFNPVPMAPAAGLVALLAAGAFARRRRAP